VRQPRELVQELSVRSRQRNCVTSQVIKRRRRDKKSGSKQGTPPYHTVNHKLKSVLGEGTQDTRKEPRDVTYQDRKEKKVKGGGGEGVNH